MHEEKCYVPGTPQKPGEGVNTSIHPLAVGDGFRRRSPETHPPPGLQFSILCRLAKKALWKRRRYFIPSGPCTLLAAFVC
jgi:hypothetical protein